MSTGIGYDAHRLAEGRRLVLGGVEIEFERGLLGHSDADVLVHAVIDALLGAAGLGDIGRFFPDDDPAYDGIDSLELLRRAWGMIFARGYFVGNIDAVIVAEKPRLAPFIPQMERNVAAALGIDPMTRRVNVKASTEEGMGFTGRSEGIAAQAVCTLERSDGDRRFPGLE
ncbi:MAG: 2-C-methyl-D-erythritol 2,4-cyclodiphosphate synthase [Clostridiales bacterium]|jgi:2-C-methyl-D-erythritol 2,4-cyclodiphosphate synthase|nr:2-C-methyl-D-erythritol 2,4-cyclodiphosphate synthase [Clostridiales bacterium]